MARPTTITDEQILEAARELFAQKGIHASTAEIARKARVSEGSIFKRFPTKVALFQAVMKAPPIPPWVQELDHLVGVGDLRQNLVHIAQEIISFSQNILPLVMLTWRHKSEPPAEDAPAIEPPTIRDQLLLARYLQQEVDRGRLRAGNTEVIARMLWGTAAHFVLDRLIMQRSLSQEERDAFVASLIEALWSGIAPEPPDTP